VAQQLETEGRRRLLASAADPALARGLAAVLRASSEAGSTGAREGRARLLLELLAVDAGSRQLSPATQPAAVPAGPAPAKVDPPRAVRTPRAAQPVPVAASEVAAEEVVGATASVSPPPPEAASAAPAPAPNGERPTLEIIRSRWGEVVERASPSVKPLVKECRPYQLDGARLTLAFPEGREFLRSRVTERSGAIEDLLGQTFGSSWAVECVAASVDLEPLTVEEAIAPDESTDANALLQRTLEITGGQLLDIPEVRT
jgi:hypothetical protein